MSATPLMDELEEGHALTELYNKRVKQNQDLFVIVSDYHNRRGTGKTVASLRLAHALDRTDEGVTFDKTTLSVEEITDAYVDQPKGSALVLDEAEAGVSKYEAGTATNKAIRRLISMGRIEEKYVVMNLPNSGEMDRDLKALADVWILVTARGTAQCNILGWNPWEQHPTTAAQHPFAWGDIPKDSYLRDVYNKLSDEKRMQLRDGEGTNYVPADEVGERIDKARETTEKKLRNQWIKAVYEKYDITQQEIADLDTVDLSRSSVANILRG